MIRTESVAELAKRVTAAFPGRADKRAALERLEAMLRMPPTLRDKHIEADRRAVVGTRRRPSL